MKFRQDGTLDLSDEALATLDLCGAAVHSHFDLPRADTTMTSGWASRAGEGYRAPPSGTPLHSATSGRS